VYSGKIQCSHTNRAASAFSSSSRRKPRIDQPLDDSDVEGL